MLLIKVKFPKKFFQNIIQSPQWDVMALRLKPEYDSRSTGLPVAVEFSYKSHNNYYPLLIGLDYTFMDEAKIYKQLLYRIVERAIILRSEKIYFGVTASLEKRKLGAVIKSPVAYVYLKDTFETSLLNLITDDS
jgi:hypothetical protein